MTETYELDLCIMCDKFSSLSCNCCKSSHYCSTSCQRADWPVHRLLCASFLRLDASSRPTDEHIRAILFPVDKEEPKVIWLHCEWKEEEFEGSFQLCKVESFLGHDARARVIPVLYNPIMRRQLPDTIEICYSETFLAEGSNPNKSIAAILATKPEQHHDWRGPIIAYGKEGLGVNQPFCRDLDMTDFRQVADYFLSYKYSPTPGLQPFLGLKIKGVRINCIGDQELFDKRQFEAVEIPLTDSIFTKHDTSDIAKRIGLPIFTRCYPPSPSWVNNQDNKIFKGKIAFSNRDASFLHLCCDPNAKFEQSTGRSGWGSTSMQWQNSVGSVLVARQDKKPLFPSHVEALCKYCRYQISPLMAHSHGEYAPEEPMEKDAVLSMICRPTFVIFWHKLLHAKIKEEGWEEYNTPYPYDI